MSEFITRTRFRQNLEEAICDKDTYVEFDQMDIFLDENFENSKELLDKWSYADYSNFAVDIATLGFWKAVDENDFRLPGEEITISDELGTRTISAKDAKPEILEKYQKYIKQGDKYVQRLY